MLQIQYHEVLLVELQYLSLLAKSQLTHTICPIASRGFPLPYCAKMRYALLNQLIF